MQSDHSVFSCLFEKDPVLFTGSLRMNLDPFGEFSDQQLWQVLEQSNLKEFVQGLEKKLEFEITEGGDNLRYSANHVPTSWSLGLFKSTEMS